MITVISTKENQSLDSDTGRVLKTMQVKWRIDAQHGPYVEVFPYDGFDGTAARLVLEDRARQILAVRG